MTQCWCSGSSSLNFKSSPRDTGPAAKNESNRNEAKTYFPNNPFAHNQRTEEMSVNQTSACSLGAGNTNCYVVCSSFYWRLYTASASLYNVLFLSGVFEVAVLKVILLHIIKVSPEFEDGVVHRRCVSGGNYFWNEPLECDFSKWFWFFSKLYIFFVSSSLSVTLQKQCQEEGGLPGMARVLYGCSLLVGSEEQGPQLTGLRAVVNHSLTRRSVKCIWSHNRGAR